MPSYSLEKSLSIYDDSTGEHWDIVPDRDGLEGIFEFQYYIGGSLKPDLSIAFPVEIIPLLITALEEFRLKI